MNHVPFPQDKKKLSFRRALIRILLSTLAVSGTVSIALLYYFHIQEIQLLDDRFTIKYIERTGPDRERLPSSYLAELLGLSADGTANLMDYKTDRAQKSLLESPLFASARIWKVGSGTLAVDFRIRTPLFRLTDFSNTCIDEEGTLMPLEPFFKGEGLPELCLGNLGSGISWGARADREKMDLGLDILREAQKQNFPESFQLSRIDVSKIEEQSFGQRQAVLVFRNEWILRLRLEEVSLQMEQFSLLIETVLSEDAAASPRIVDMRVPQLAFMRHL